uniref:G_PROTEIN_RECEP_F1_2 domain-containing protein n=1 Tax=Steinernema glaseri TaxID=37863 RepID=A0A1I7ZHQ5_9BILA
MWECATDPVPALHTIGGQWPSALTLLLGFERLTAVRFPWWYHQLYERHQVVSVSCVSLFVTASLAIGICCGVFAIPEGVTIYICSIGKSYGPEYAHQVVSVSCVSLFVAASLAVGICCGVFAIPEGVTIYICSIGKSYGPEYATYNFTLTIGGHVAGMCATMLAFVMARNRIEQAGFNRLREMQSFKLIFSITILSLIFIVVPNIYFILQRFLPHSQAISGYMYCAFCLRSCSNIALMWILNKDYRHHVRKLYSRMMKKMTDTESTRIFTSRQ